jgi:hypothetical protein
MSQAASAASTINVKNAVPPPGYPVDGDTVIRADIAYQIGDFDPSHGKYILVPMFDTKDGPDQTFNELPSSASALQLKAKTGDAHLVYPLRREWASGKLAKPIRVRYLIMQVGRNHTLTPVTETEVYEYKAR